MQGNDNSNTGKKGKSLHIIIALYRYVFWGGLQRDTLRMAQEAVERGHKVTVFTTSWENPPDFINVECIPPSGMTNVSRMRHFNEAWKKRLAVKDYDKAIAMDRVEGADFYFAADSCLKAYYKRKYPAWLLAIMPRYRFILGMEKKLCCPGSKTVIWYISPFQRKEYMEEYGTPESQLAELPPGMSPACVRPDENQAAAIRAEKRKELGLTDNDIAVVLVGTNAKRKGMDRLVSAAASLPEELRKKVRILLVGKVEDNEIRPLAEKLGIWEQCILPGATQNVERMLFASDIMVHPAREEGTGTVLVEGIAAGIPVICSECCGFSPYVKEAAGLVTPEPFEQTVLDNMLRDAIENLPEITEKTRIYGKAHDFTARQKVMLDYIEAKA